MDLDTRLAWVRSHLELLVEMSDSTCGFCKLLKGRSDHNSHLSCLTPLVLLRNLTLALHQVTCSLHEWRQAVHCLGQVSQVRAHQYDRVALKRKRRHDRPGELGILTHHSVADYANLLNVLVGQLDRAASTRTATFTSIWPVRTGTTSTSWSIRTGAVRTTWTFRAGTTRTTWSLWSLPGRTSRSLWWHRLSCLGWSLASRWTGGTHHVLEHRHRVLLPASWLAHILHHLAHHVIQLARLAHALHNRVDLVHVWHLEARRKSWYAAGWHLWLTLRRCLSCSTASGAGCVRIHHHVDSHTVLVD